MTSITLFDPKVTKAGTVRFYVLFDYPVPLDASHFGLLTTGVTGASIVSALPDPTGTAYTVTVNTGSGSGNIALAVTGAPAFQQTTVGIAGSGGNAKFLDFDGDGRQDIVTVGGPVGAVQLRLGDGSFTTIGAAGSGAQVFTVDLNGDGRQEIVTIGDANGTVKVISRDGAGNNITTTVGTADLAAQVLFADVNGDGRTDIITAGRDSGNVRAFLQQSTGAFALEGSALATGGGTRMGIADFNSDGRLDIAHVSGPSGTVETLLRNPGGGFTSAPVGSVGGSFGADLAVGDINGDGRADIAVVNSTGSVTMFLKQSGPGYITGTLSSVGSQAHIRIVDITGDGVPDLVTVGLTGAGNVTLFRGTGGGGFALPVVIGAAGSNPSFRVVDVNGDARPDFVSSGGGTGETKVLFNNGNNTFTTYSVGSAGGTVPSLDVGDLNGDGRIDLLTVGGANGDVKTLLGVLGGPYEIDRAAPVVVVAQKSGNSGATKTFSGIVADTHAPGSQLKIYDNNILVGATTVGSQIKTIDGVTGYAWTKTVHLANTANKHVFKFVDTDTAGNVGPAKFLSLTLTGAVTRNGTSGADTLYGGRGNDKLNGLAGNDKLRADAGNDVLSGGSGKDILLGALGRDIMTGGAGNDVFDFDAVSETGKTASTRDRITDFSHRHDKIDLRTIDADGGGGTNRAFKFVAKEGASFTGVKGQLIWDQQDKKGTSKDVTIISGDINGDRKADFQIELTGLKTLSSGDFLL